MSDLRTELDQLEDMRLDYVLARSRVNSDARGYRNAGISKATFYTWPEEERKKLNDIAQRVKREVAVRVMMIFQEAAEQAAQTKTDGLKSRHENIKQNAATEILDRILGKPTQHQEVNATGDIVIRWDDVDND